VWIYIWKPEKGLYIIYTLYILQIYSAYTVNTCVWIYIWKYHVWMYLCVNIHMKTWTNCWRDQQSACRLFTVFCLHKDCNDRLQTAVRLQSCLRTAKDCKQSVYSHTCVYNPQSRLRNVNTCVWIYIWKPEKENIHMKTWKRGRFPTQQVLWCRHLWKSAEIMCRYLWTSYKSVLICIYVLICMYWYVYIYVRGSCDVTICENLHFVCKHLKVSYMNVFIWI